MSAEHMTTLGEHVDTHGEQPCLVVNEETQHDHATHSVFEQRRVIQRSLEYQTRILAGVDDSLERVRAAQIAIEDRLERLEKMVKSMTSTVEDTQKAWDTWVYGTKFVRLLWRGVLFIAVVVSGIAAMYAGLRWFEKGN
jgi:hypothetical protein